MENNAKSFKEIIKDYLDNRAQNDPLFAKSYAKENKNINECCDYIKECARKEAVNNFAAVNDEVVLGWAVHYYDEDSIKVGKSVSRTEVKSSPNTEDKQAPKMKLRKKEDVGQLSLF